MIADFWNSGTAVDGCLSISGHGHSGYMYVDWYGHITPCVFVPYAVNINDIYAKGGTLGRYLQAPFFKNLRDWQVEMKAKTGASNLMNPCPIRDHNADLRRLVHNMSLTQLTSMPLKLCKIRTMPKAWTLMMRHTRRSLMKFGKKHIKQQRLSQEEHAAD